MQIRAQNMNELCAKTIKILVSLYGTFAVIWTILLPEKKAFEI